MLADRLLLGQLEGCFEEGEVKTMVKQGGVGVKILHRETQLEVKCSAHGSLLQNKAQAVLMLINMLLESRIRRDL